MFVRSQDYSVNISFKISKVSIPAIYKNTRLDIPFDTNTLEAHLAIFDGTRSKNTSQRHSDLSLDEYFHQLVLKGFKYFVFFRTRDSPKKIS